MIDTNKLQVGKIYFVQVSHLAYVGFLLRINDKSLTLHYAEDFDLREVVGGRSVKSSVKPIIEPYETTIRVIPLSKITMIEEHHEEFPERTLSSYW